MKRILLAACLLLALIASAVAQVPTGTKVFIVTGMRHSYSAAMNSSTMPYLNSLAAKYGLATQYYANTQPTIGNYFMMTTGQTVTNDNSYAGTVSADNVVRQLMTAGKTWKAYAEDIPSTGYLGGNVNGYRKYRNPFAYLSDVVNSSSEPLNIVPFTQFGADFGAGQLPNYSFIIPNTCHSGNSCTLTDMDNWLKANIAPLLASATFQNDGLLIITFDSSTSTDLTNGGGHVATLVISSKAKTGYKPTTLYQHQSLLRLSMAALGITSVPGAGATANDMGEFFTASTTTSSTTTTASTASSTTTTPTNKAPVAVLNVTPTTGTAPVTATVDSSASYDSDGSIASRLITFGDGTSTTSATATHTYSNAGTYTVTLKVTDNGGLSSSATKTITVAAAPTTTSTTTTTTSAAPTTTTTTTTSTAPTTTSTTTSSTSCDASVSPGQSLGSAMGRIGSGQTLCVHGGTYTENIATGIASGAKVVAYPGERPVVVGLMWLSGLSNVTIDGINVTWNSANGSSNHMVKFSGGSGWTFKNSEVWGAHSYAGILVSSGASNFKMQNLYVHDTYKSNDTNQDHLIYVNGANGGIIERSLFANSPNGRGIKLGPPSGGTGGPGNIIIRYNTFYNNTGPSNVQLSYGSHDNQVYRNIFQLSSAENVTAYNLNGTGNTVHDNVGWQSSAVASSSIDKGGNLHVDPQLGGNYQPQNSQATNFGRYDPSNN